MRKRFPEILGICFAAIIFYLFLLFRTNGCFAGDQTPYGVKPWEVGQYVLYQIVTFEEEGGNNRYKVSLTGKEVLNGQTFFWMQIDIYEDFIYHGYNTITQKLEKNISFRLLVPPKNTASFFSDPARFIEDGVLPKDAVRAAVQIKDGEWHWVEPQGLFSHQHIIEDTPYILTPDARGKIDFSKMNVNPTPAILTTESGDHVPCYRFFVHTSVEDEYFDEGFSLWRSPRVPILGIVRMDFSQTRYWEKWSYRNEQPIKTPFDFFRQWYKKRVPGRRSPDTCFMKLLDYGPK